MLDNRNEMLTKLDELITAELKESQLVYEERYHSLHEAESIIREEIEESKEALSAIEHEFHLLHSTMRDGDSQSFKDFAEEIDKYAKYLALEAVQVAATARKVSISFENDQEERN